MKADAINKINVSENHAKSLGYNNITITLSIAAELVRGLPFWCLGVGGD